MSTTKFFKYSWATPELYTEFPRTKMSIAIGDTIQFIANEVLRSIDT